MLTHHKQWHSTSYHLFSWIISRLHWQWADNSLISQLWYSFWSITNNTYQLTMTIFWMHICRLQDLWKHERFVQHTVIESVHKNESIKKLQYISHNDLIITGSASPKTSVVIIDRKGSKKPYTFKLAKVSKYTTSYM